MKLRVNRLAAKTSKRPVTDPTGGHRVAEVNLSKYMEIGAWRAPWRVARRPFDLFLSTIEEVLLCSTREGQWLH